jgi:hypothetical protein
VLSAASVARTWKVCEPSGSVVYETPLVHGPNAAESSRHSKVEPASSELNVNVALVAPVGLAGLVTIVVFGGVESWFAYGPASHAAAASFAWPAIEGWKPSNVERSPAANSTACAAPSSYQQFANSAQTRS